MNQGSGRHRRLLNQNKEETEDQADIRKSDIDLLSNDLNLDLPQIH